MRFVVVTIGYLLASWWVLKELAVGQAPRRSFWITMTLLFIGCAWMLYAVSTMRPTSPLEGRK